jgi:predicted lipase
LLKHVLGTLCLVWISLTSKINKTQAGMHLSKLRNFPKSTKLRFALVWFEKNYEQTNKYQITNWHDQLQLGFTWLNSQSSCGYVRNWMHAKSHI